MAKITSKERLATDKRLDKLEKKLEKLYSDAEQEISQEWNAYMEKASKIIEDKQMAYEAALASGNQDQIKTTKEALQSAQKSELLQNKKYKEMLDDTTRKLANVNQEVVQMVNSELPWVYTTNYNAIKELAEDVGISFKLTNIKTIKSLLEHGVPMKKVDIPKDMLWNQKKINNAILQGISRGESIPKISNRLFPIIDEKSPKRLPREEREKIIEYNKNAAIRNARTMVTTAENKAKMDSFHDLEDAGLVIKKHWIATGDDRTRDWHLSMDGQEVDIDEPFIDGLDNELEYPGDPNAEPETYYNCRCTMKAKVIGFRRDDGSVSRINYDVEGRGQSRHEKEIEEEKERRK